MIQPKEVPGFMDQRTQEALRLIHVGHRDVGLIVKDDVGLSQRTSVSSRAVNAIDEGYPCFLHSSGDVGRIRQRTEGNLVRSVP